MIVQKYQERLATEKSEVLPKVRAALKDRETGLALEIRRNYEAQQPLGKANWTEPEPQMSHSALTRRILFIIGCCMSMTRRAQTGSDFTLPNNICGAPIGG